MKLFAYPVPSTRNEYDRVVEELTNTRHELDDQLCHAKTLGQVIADLTKNTAAYAAERDEFREQADEYRDQRDEARATIDELDAEITELKLNALRAAGA